MMTSPQPFWGPITSTIDWCEGNYVVTPYIAEFWNTISNISFLIFGLFGWYKSRVYRFERAFHLLYLGVVVIGVGSAAFHATLRFHQQYSDETPMVWSMMIWIYQLYRGDVAAGRAWLIAMVLGGWAMVFSYAHWKYQYTTFFQLHFGLLVLVALTRMSRHWYACNDKHASRLFRNYLLTSTTALACWLVDFHLCHHLHALHIKPHAMWHILMGINSYFGPAHTQFIRAQQMGLKPSVKYAAGIVPYVVVKQPTHRV